MARKRDFHLEVPSLSDWKEILNISEGQVPQIQWNKDDFESKNNKEYMLWLFWKHSPMVKL